MSGIILTQSAADRLRRQLRDTERRPVSKLPRLGRKYRSVSVQEKCPEVDVLTLFGPITGGTVKLRYRLQDVTADAVLDWDTDADTAQATLISSHSKINSGDVFVVGGPWPTVSLHIIWDGQYKGKYVFFPAVIPDLTGGGTCNFWKASSSNWRGYYS